MNEAKIAGLKKIIGRAKSANIMAKGPLIEQAVDWMVEIIETQEEEIKFMRDEVMNATTRK